MDLDGSVVVVLGAGGAARSIVEALGRQPVDQTIIVNRTPERAAACAELAASARVGGAEAVAHADVIVNTTSVGMAGDPDLPLDPHLLSGRHTVVDIIYNPAVTPLLAAAQKVGAATANGLSMLVHQAVLQIAIWTGSTPDTAPLLAVAQAELSARSAAGR